MSGFWSFITVTRINSSQSLDGCRGTTDDLPPFSVFCYSQGFSKFHSCPFFDVIFPLFFCLPLLIAPFTVLTMPEDREMWPCHLSFCFFTIVRRLSCKNVLQLHAGFCCEPPCSSNGICSISSQWLGSVFRGLKSRSSSHIKDKDIKESG